MTKRVDPYQLASSDVDLHCLQRQGICEFSRTRVKINTKKKKKKKMRVEMLRAGMYKT